MIPVTVNDLIADVRFALDEDNTEDVSDARIIKGLNKGANNCYHILAKQYDQFFITSGSATTDGTSQIDIPSDAYGRRVEYLTYFDGTNNIRVRKVQPSKLHKFETPNSSNSYPQVYTTRGDQIILAPTPKSGVLITINYMRKPSTLVKSQGRVIDVTGDVITVDSIGSSIGTNVDDLSAFISVVDRSTGARKTAMQVSSISSNAITIKNASLDRAVVYGATLDTAIPSTVAIDDYVCGIGGTCIMELISDFSDYITQYATLEVKRAMRLPTDADYSQLKDLEKHVVTIWAGRENDNTITHRNTHWNKRNTGRK